MLKPINWGSVQAVNGGEGFQKLPAGGYVCRIQNVIDVPDKEYLVIDLDIAEGEFKGHFENQYVRFGGNWKCKKYQSYKEKALPMFKGFTTSVEESNDRYIWDFDENKLKGKLVGVLFGDEEYMTDSGDIRVIAKPQFFRSVKTIRDGDFTTPSIKRLRDDGKAEYAGTANGIPNYVVNDKTNIDSMADYTDDVPF